MAATCTIARVILLICALGSFDATAAGEGIYVGMAGNEHVVHLSTAQWQAVRDYNPEFQIRRQQDYLPSLVQWYEFTNHQAPFAVTGDFNGDGREDAALQGHDKDSDLLIAVLSSGQGPHVIEIQESPLFDTKNAWYELDGRKESGFWIYLNFVPKGKVTSSFEAQPLQLANDAFELQYFQKAAVLYYLKDGAFQQYMTGD